MRIVVGCVVYNNEDEVENFLNHQEFINNSEKVSVAIYVNASTYTKEKLEGKLNRSRRRNIKIFYGAENLGYLKGCLKAIELLSENADFYMITNTDVEFEDNFFDLILKGGYKNRIGVIAPSIFSLKNNSYQNPHYKHRISEKKIKTLIRITTYPSIFYLYDIISAQKQRFFKNNKEESQVIYAPHGSCFVMKDYFYEYVKTLNFSPKMYSEEAFIAEELINSNYVCFYDSSLKMRHNESTTTSLLKINRKAKYFKDSLEFIYTEYYRVSKRKINNYD